MKGNGKIRIVSGGEKHRKEAKVGNSLEGKAREIAEHGSSHPWDPSPTDSVRREISLALEELQRWQQLHEDLNRSLLRSECYVEAERMQMEQRMPSYSHYRFVERQKFQKQLGTIEEERRKLIVAQEERTQSLQRHLLSLLNKHAHLT